MTPEERLLHLIRRHSSKATPESGTIVSAPAVSIRSATRSWNQQRRVQMIQRGLLLVSLFNLFVLTGGVVAHQVRIRQIDELLARPVEVGKVPSDPFQDSQSTPDPSADIGQISQGRELFRLLAAPPPTKPRTDSGESQRLIRDRLKELTLVGIVAGAGSSGQAIIDDQSAKKTYFLKEGESASDFRVVQILKGKVLLEVNGEQQELTL